MRNRFFWALLIMVLCGLSSVLVYGVVDRNLDYHETNFSNNEWFNVLQNVTLNTTTNKMYLNGYVTKNYFNIDCTTYTKSGTHTTVTTSQVRHSYDSNNDEDFVYKDFGVGFWTMYKGLAINYTLLNSDNNAYRFSVPISLGNSINGYADDNNRLIVVTTHWGSSEYDLYLGVGERINNAWTNFNENSVTTTLTRDVNYYCTFYINATHCVNEVYSDSARTTRIRYLWMELNDDDYAYRYLFLARSYSGALGADGSIVDTYSKDYHIRYYTNGIETKGYAYTVDLLMNETDIAFSSFVNSTIGASCNLKVYFSDDNNTWIQKFYQISTNCNYVNIENLNYTSLYAKFEFTGNGINNIELLNFGYTNIFTLSGAKPNYVIWIVLITCIPTMLLILYKVGKHR